MTETTDTDDDEKDDEKGIKYNDTYLTRYRRGCKRE